MVRGTWCVVCGVVCDVWYVVCGVWCVVRGVWYQEALGGEALPPPGVPPGAPPAQIPTRQLTGCGSEDTEPIEYSARAGWGLVYPRAHQNSKEGMVLAYLGLHPNPTSLLVDDKGHGQQGVIFTLTPSESTGKMLERDRKNLPTLPC